MIEIELFQTSILQQLRLQFINTSALSQIYIKITMSLLNLLALLQIIIGNSEGGMPYQMPAPKCIKIKCDVQLVSSGVVNFGCRRGNVLTMHKDANRILKPLQLNGESLDRNHARKRHLTRRIDNKPKADQKYKDDMQLNSQVSGLIVSGDKKTSN